MKKNDRDLAFSLSRATRAFHCTFDHQTPVSAAVFWTNCCEHESKRLDFSTCPIVLQVAVPFPGFVFIALLHFN